MPAAAPPPGTPPGLQSPMAFAGWPAGSSPASLTGRVPPVALAATTYGSTATEASSTVTLPAFANGDTVYLGYELTATNGTVTVPAGWVEAVPQFRSTTSTSSLHGVLRRVMQPGDATTLAVTHTSGRFAAVAVTVQGADQSAPEDTFATDANPNSVYPNVEIPGAAPVVVNGLALAWAALRNGTNAATTTFTPPAGFTEFGDATSNVAAISNAAVEGSSQALTSNAQVPGGNATASSSSGTSINQMGSLIVVRGAVPAPVRYAQQPVLGRPAYPPAGGRIQFRSGPAAQAGAPQAGPPVYPLGHPVQARQLPQRGGTITRHAGTYAQVGPVVYPLGHPVQARRFPQRGGQATAHPGTFAGVGPQLRPARGPVRATPPLPPRGRAQSRAGVYTAVVTGSGPPIYPFRGPVRTRPQPPPRGRVVKTAGVYAQVGPPVRPAQGPVGVSRRQPPPPTRGRVASQRGPYGQTGPPTIPLRRPVRGQPQRPQLTGRTSARAGVLTIPVGPQFTIGALIATDTATATQAPADKAANALTASTAASGALTATDQRTGGPG